MDRHQPAVNRSEHTPLAPCEFLASKPEGCQRQRAIDLERPATLKAGLFIPITDAWLMLAFPLHGKGRDYGSLDRIGMHSGACEGRDGWFNTLGLVDRAAA